MKVQYRKKAMLVVSLGNGDDLEGAKLHRRTGTGKLEMSGL